MKMQITMQIIKSRSGTVLIIVSGISALLASLALAFLLRMRTDIEEAQAVEYYAQAKLMLAAGCNYVMESSRLGYDGISRPSPLPGSANGHDEAYGWVDVRDGSVGPRFQDINNPVWTVPSGSPLPTITVAGVSRPLWPQIGGIVRCPVYRIKRPPFAVSLQAAYNKPADLTDPWPLLINPDPQPADNTSYNSHASGDRTPEVTSVGKSWFRVLRDGPTTFLISCGAGGTSGFKDWDEVVAYNAELQFGSAGVQGKRFFLELRSMETILWYRVEWLAAGLDVSNNLYSPDAGSLYYMNNYLMKSRNISQGNRWGARNYDIVGIGANSVPRYPVGVIHWIQRLRNEPTFW